MGALNGRNGVRQRLFLTGVRRRANAGSLPLARTKLLQSHQMKKRALWFTVLLAAAISAFGDGDKKDLMARMGFSKEEIAKDGAAQKATTGTLRTVSGKSDPKEAALLLREASEVNKLRELSAIRQEARSFAEAAEEKASLAKAKQKEAEEKAEAARREIRRMAFGGSANWTYANALDARDTLERKAEEAREAADDDPKCGTSPC